MQTQLQVQHSAVEYAENPESVLAGTGGPDSVEIINVPDIAGDWFLGVVDVANRSPTAVVTLMELFSAWGILLLAALWAFVFWRSRSSTARTMALTLAGAVGVLTSYGLSEWAKTYLEAERPCRTFPEVVIAAAECPPPGDWSFPSNHATIAGALFVALVCVSRPTGLIGLPIALAVTFSRTFVGVHYPHDVVVGFVLGAAVTTTVVILLVRPVTQLVRTLRTDPFFAYRRILGPEPTHQDSADSHAPR